MTLAYRIATKLNKEDNEIQVGTLIYSMGKQAEHVYITLTLDLSRERRERRIWDSSSTI